MQQLTLLLFERMGILLIAAFIITRTPQFAYLLDRRRHFGQRLTFSVFFGLLSIAGTYAGVAVQGASFTDTFLPGPLRPEEAMADSSLIGVIAAGLLGGTPVGIGAGLISGLHAYGMGGMTALPKLVVLPVVGLLAGLIARFFDEERVIDPIKALLISVFPPILLMGIILVAEESSARAILIVNQMGVPMVIGTSVGVGIFVLMILAAITEEERAAALETQRALHIAERVLPYLKMGLSYETAGPTADLMLGELRADAVAVTDTERILAYAGVGAELRVKGEAIRSELSHRALLTGRVQVARAKEEMELRHPSIGAAVIIPFSSGNQTAGLVKLYYQSIRQITPVELALAEGLSKLISIQLELAMAEALRGLMKEAELKALQAQINPHFLFNTLNSIYTLIRTDPDSARRVLVQLASYLRMNLTMTQSPLILLSQELEHLETYLGIAKIRFEDRLAFSLTCDPGLEAVRIPPSTLQPLVENSIHHGFKDERRTGEIRMELRREHGRVQVRITDNGVGFDPGLLDRLGHVPLQDSGSTGLGLHNVNRRLVHLFGPEARLRFSAAPGGGACVAFTLPLQMG